MYHTDGLPYQASDRQYMIIIDDVDDNKNIFNTSGFKVQELISKISGSDIDEISKVHDLVSDLPYSDIDEISINDDLTHDVGLSVFEKTPFATSNFNGNCDSLIVHPCNNNYYDSEIEYLSVKTTQTYTKFQEQGINTTTNSNTVQTQTCDSNSSHLRNEQENSSASSYFPIRETNIRIHPCVDVKLTDIETSDSSQSSNESLSNRHSAIHTYSIEHSIDSRSYDIEYSKSICSSLSCEDLRIVSDNDMIENISSITDSESSKESELILYLDQECMRKCYIPNEKHSWDFCKAFELKQFDEIIKSHLNRSDRRLKAISNKMSCKIEIIGPYCNYLQHPYARHMAELYKLAIYSDNRMRLEKSVNSIQISFPNSCFNEKIYKSHQSLNR